MGREVLQRSGVQQRQLSDVQLDISPAQLVAAQAPTPQSQLPLIGLLFAPTPRDTIVDLGCGDGRVCVYLAKTYGCKCIGYEIDTRQAYRARQAVKTAGVSHLVEIRHEDAVDADLSRVDGVYVYLYPKMLDRLADMLQAVPCVISYHHPIPGVLQRKTGDFFVAHQR